MESFFTKLFEAFSVEYMFSVIIASYLTLKTIDTLNGKRSIPSWVKRVVTCIVGAILFALFSKYTDVSVQCLIASFFSAVFLYDTAIKLIIKKFNIGYRDADNY